MGLAMNLTKAEPLEHFAIGRLSTRETLIREIQERAIADLYSESDVNRGLNGPLGEHIAIASGSFSLDFTDAEHIAQGVVAWLNQTFLQSPQDFGPQGVSSNSASLPPNSEAGQGLREAGSQDCGEQGVSHCPHWHAGDQECCYCRSHKNGEAAA